MKRSGVDPSQNLGLFLSQDDREIGRDAKVKLNLFKTPKVALYFMALLIMTALQGGLSEQQ